MGLVRKGLGEGLGNVLEVEVKFSYSAIRVR